MNTLSAGEVVSLAAKHVDSCSNLSAHVRLADAEQSLDYGRENDARRAALDSLQHSVGVFHPDYQRAAGV